MDVGGAVTNWTWDHSIGALLKGLWTPVGHGCMVIAAALLTGSLFVRHKTWKLGVVVTVVVLIFGNTVWPIQPAVAVIAATGKNAWARATSGDGTHVSLTCGGVEPVLATIRTMESGGNYAAEAAGVATASGAYQFTDGTWNGYGGFSHAADAPPSIQDERARGDVTRFMAEHNNDVGVIPVLWYIGHLPSAGEWDAVPWASQGNTLTPRQYQSKWLKQYERQTAACSGG